MRLTFLLVLFGLFLLWMLPIKQAQAEVHQQQNPVDSNAMKSQVAIGQDLYNTHCHKCHVLKDPAKRTKEKWERIMPKMAKKAKLTPEQQDLISKFVMSVSKED